MVVNKYVSASHNRADHLSARVTCPAVHDAPVPGSAKPPLGWRFLPAAPRDQLPAGRAAPSGGRDRAGGPRSASATPLALSGHPETPTPERPAAALAARLASPVRPAGIVAMLPPPVSTKVRQG